MLSVAKDGILGRVRVGSSSGCKGFVGDVFVLRQRKKEGRGREGQVDGKEGREKGGKRTRRTKCRVSSGFYGEKEDDRQQGALEADTGERDVPSSRAGRELPGGGCLDSEERKMRQSNLKSRFVVEAGCDDWTDSASRCP